MPNVRDSRPTADDPRQAGVRVLALGDERHLAVVVVEADPDEPLVGGPLVEAEALQVALEDRLLGERAVEVHHQRLVLGPDRPDRRASCPSGQVHVRDVLPRVGPDRQARQVPRVGRRVMEDDARVERDQPLGRCEQRVDVDLADPALLDDELAEADEELLELVEVDAAAPADALERAV